MIPKPLMRVERFENMAFGLFVHWGLYSIKENGEWTMKIHNIPKEEYSKLSNEFDAKGYDPKRFVKIAKKAGVKYITLTTKHHDGFFLYDTKGLSKYDAINCGPKRDLVREFVEACNEEEIMPIFYHATYDWYKENYENNFELYLEYLKKSVEILCKNYGEIGGLWFDGNWDKPEANWKLDELYKMIRKYQPNALIINNTGLSKMGQVIHDEIDSVTYEQGIPNALNREGMSKYITGEMCQTMNNHWGISRNDLNYKSTKELIETLCKCRKVGANYLLNVGVTKDGNISNLEEAMLEVIGQWMDINGYAIYNGRPCDVKSIGKDFALEDSDGHLYLFIHDLKIIGDENVILGGEGDNPKTFTRVKKTINKIEWMDSGEELNFIQDEKTGLLTINATGYPYGTNLVVRVAKVY